MARSRKSRETMIEETAVLEAEAPEEQELAEDFDSPSADISGRKMSKAAMVREAIDNLGGSPSTEDIHAYLLQRFHLDMKNTHISSYKSTYLKKKSQEGRRRGRREVGRLKLSETNGSELLPLDVISLKDIRAIRGLADRLGSIKFREVIDLLFPRD